MNLTVETQRSPRGPRRPHCVLLCVISAAFLCASAVKAQQDVRELLESKALERLRALDANDDGVLGAAAIDLATGRVLAYHGDGIFPTASAIKVPVMIQVFRTADLDREVTVAKHDLVDGSARLSVMLRHGPATATVRELVEAMIEVSDNTAANKLIDLVGMDSVNRLLDELGCPNTRLRRKMMDWTDTDRRENISTPVEMARIVSLIYQNKAAPPPACAEMMKIMKRVEANFRTTVPSRIEVASKPGEMPGVRCETGIVFLPKRPFALAVMSTFIRDDRNPVPAAASLLFELFNKLAASNRYGHRLD